MKGRKILVLLPVDGFGGTEVHSLLVGSYLKNKGADLHFAFQVSDRTARLYSGCIDRGFNVINLPIALAQGDHISAFEQQHEYVKNLLDGDESYDLAIVAAPSPLCAPGVMKGLKNFKIPTLVIFHFCSKTFVATQQVKKYFVESLTADFQLVGVSEYVADRISEAFSLPETSVSFINNGVDVHDELVGDNEVFFSKMGLQGKRILFTPGRYHKQKSLDVLVESIPNVIQVIPNVHFVLMGDGPDKEDLINKAKELGVSGCISMLGFYSDAYKLFKHADVALIPTRDEGLSLRLLEAMHMGATIVTTNVAYQNNIILDGVNGYIAEVESAESLSEKIITALTDDSRKLVGSNAKSLAKEKYSFERMASEYFELITLMLCKKHVFPVKKNVLILDLGIDRDEIVIGHPIKLNLIDEKLSIPIVEVIDFFKFGEKIGTIELSETIKDIESLVIALVDIYLFSREITFGKDLQRLVLEIIKKSNFSTSFIGKVLKKFLFGNVISKLNLDNLTEMLYDLSSKNVLSGQELTEEVSKLIWNSAISRAEYKKLSEQLFLRGYISASQLKMLLREFNLVSGKIEIDTHISATADKPSRTVLMFSSHYAYPPRNGSEQRVTQMITNYVSLGYKVILQKIAESGITDEKTIYGLRRDYGVITSIIYLNESETKRIRDAFDSVRCGSNSLDPFYNEYILLKFSELLSLYAPDIVHINYVIFSWLSIACQLSPGTTLILDAHDVHAQRCAIFSQIRKICGKCPSTTQDIPLSRFLDSSLQSLEYEPTKSETDAYKLFDKIIAISKRDASAMGCFSREIEVIPFIPCFNRDFVDNKKSLGGTHNARKGMYIGSSNPLNLIGLAVIESIAKRLLDLYPACEINLYGGVGSACAPNSKIINRGFVENVRDSYFNNDYAFCTPMLGTGQNIKAIESVSYGLPVIAYQGLADSSLVIDGVNGATFSSLEDLYEIVSEWTRSESAYRRIKESTVTWAEENLTEIKSIKLLNNLLNGTR
jgi:glycosyltransferase involved in cell wall biosynthesis